MASFCQETVGRMRRVGMVIALAAAPAVVWAADGAGRFITRSAPDDPNAVSVEMFDGIANGDLDVKVIPKDSRQATILIENKTDKPLSVKLPDAFGAVPVLRKRRAAPAAAAAPSPWAAAAAAWAAWAAA